mmetsp:Transcript_1056/g.1867  ORF Transcript_1056/g.1867 Transcript_1056/m.1867 type:complete len:93 (+) Transcript_1056:41-319(+)
MVLQGEALEPGLSWLSIAGEGEQVLVTLMLSLPRVADVVGSRWLSKLSPMCSDGGVGVGGVGSASPSESAGSMAQRHGPEFRWAGNKLHPTS